jgi:hypothetical protein
MISKAPFVIYYGGLAIFMVSCLVSLFDSGISFLGFLAGAFIGFIGFILVISWSLINLKRAKPLHLVLALGIGAVVVLPFKLWQSIGEDCFFWVHHQDYEELYRVVQQVPQANDIRTRGGQLEINFTQVQFKDSVAIFAKAANAKMDEPDSIERVISAVTTRELVLRMQAANTWWITKTTGFVMFEVGGMLDTRFGFLRILSNDLEAKVKRENSSLYLKSEGNGWYYYNTGS